MGFVITSDYDSEAMSADIADAINDTMNAEIGETFSLGDGHAFNVVTPSDRKFLVTVTEVENENP